MSLRRFFRRARWDEERARELESYVAIETDENVARGMTPDAARAAARRKLGNQTMVREEIYRMNTIAWLDDLWRDLTFGLRQLRLNPGFAVVAILSLALGIGANTAIFQLLDAVRLRTLPVRDPEALVSVDIVNTPNLRSGEFNGRFTNLTNPVWEGIRDRQQAFDGVFAWGATIFELASRGESQPAAGIWVSGDFFSTLGVQPLVGRLLTAADDRRGCGAPGAVLSYAFWQRRYGGDPNVVGRPITLSGHPVDVVGVTPPGFYGLEVGRIFDVAVPICAQPILEPGRNGLDIRNYWWLAVVGRLKPGWSPQRASAQLASISPAIFADTVPPNYPPDFAKQYRSFALGAVPAGSGFSRLRQDYATPLWMLLSIAGLVLLIACGNLANLMLARASAREREIAVRLAVGASRGRLVGQLTAEAAIVAVCGAGLGALFAARLERVLLSFFANTWLFLDLRPDWRVLAFTIAVAAATCLVFGAMPALRATTVNPRAAISPTSRGVSDGPQRLRLRHALVVAQMALSLVLVVGALLFVRTLRNLATADAGFQRDGVLAVKMDVRPMHLAGDRRPAFEREMIDRVRPLPGVDAVAAASIVPMSGAGWNDRIVVDGVLRRELTNFDRVSPGFLDTLRVPLLRGRDFTEHDNRDTDTAAIVTETFVRTFMKDRDPLGRTFTLEVGPGERSPVFHIVGVAKDAKFRQLRQTFEPLVFLATAQDDQPGASMSSETLLIRSRLPLASLIPEVKRTIAAAGESIVVEFEPMTTTVDRGLMRERLMAVLSGFFGGLAVLLAMIGLYGVMSYGIARRRNEIGIRMALGAERGSIIGMVMRDAAALIAAGVLVGGALAVAAAYTAQSLLFGLQPGDPQTLAAATACLTFVGLAASAVPAWRASRLDPTEALRAE